MSSSAVVGCALLSCLPAESETGAPPKNGHVSSDQIRSDDEGDAPDATVEKTAKKKAPSTGQAKAGTDDLPPASCRDDCLASSRAARVQKTYETCVDSCAEDEDCVAGCDDDKASACAATTACEVLDQCLASCE